MRRTRGPRYTPVSKRQDKPDGIAWIIRNHPDVSDGQISKLIGTTRTTIAAIPAGMGDSAFFRSDELPGRAAIGYLSLDSPRSNVFHLPVRGNGDGGIYTTLADVLAFWRAFFDGRLVPADLVDEMIRPRSGSSGDEQSYGLGFWLRPELGSVLLTGYDAGASFRTLHHPASAITFTVVSNTSEGAWPVARLLDRLFGV